MRHYSQGQSSVSLILSAKVFFIWNLLDINWHHSPLLNPALWLVNFKNKTGFDQISPTRFQLFFGDARLYNRSSISSQTHRRGLHFKKLENSHRRNYQKLRKRLVFIFFYYNSNRPRAWEWPVQGDGSIRWDWDRLGLVRGRGWF